MRARWFQTATLAVILSAGLVAQSSSRSRPVIPAEPLKEWLTYIASDELQGRQVYTEGLGLAAAYIADHLKDWGVKPVGDNGSYFQTVRILGMKTASRATVTVEVNGTTRTFKDGEGVAFPKNMGGRQTISADRILFAGYGLQIPAAQIDDYAGVDPAGAIVVWLGSDGPETAGTGSRRLLSGSARARLALEKGARAVVGPPSASLFGAAGRSGQGGTDRGSTDRSRSRGGTAQDVDFTTVQRHDRPIAPAVTAQEEFFEFLFSGSDLKYGELKQLADKRAPLPRFALKGVTLTFNVDAEYTTLDTRLTRNVVGVVEGTDPELKSTYVALGAHYDHTGYQQAVSAGGGGVNFGCAGQSRPTPREGDIINNGADDDGSGTVALMSIARAFATGSRPKRSLLFVWHTAEEGGLLGSRYNADYPVVPIDTIIAALNIDMVGRNRCDDPAEAKTVYLVGSDRISTELHNVSEDANASLADPMRLDYEMNDPADPQSIYTRSDHYSYALKGIPIIFYTTGLHRDYHYVTDEVDKIEWDKLRRVTELVYVTGQQLANLERAPARDNKGPRVGKDGGGKLR
jgi:hypothetical protein